MKINQILILIVFALVLSINVLAADSLVWRTVDGKPTVQSFNALDSGTKYETEANEIWSIAPVIFGEKNIVFLVNSDRHNSNTGEVICQETCAIYTGFEKTESFQDEMKFAITSAEEYSPGNLIINKITNEKIEPSNKVLLNEEIAFETNKGICSDYKSSACFHYKIDQNNLHILRLTNAKVIFDEQGNIKLIQGLNRDSLETAWIDGLGIPLTANDGIYFSTNEEGKTDFSKFRLVINPDVKKKEEWLKNLPDELKNEERSKISLCGNKFTNYFSDSNFLIERTEKGCSLKEYTLTTELFVEENISNWKEFEYQCGELKFQAMGGKLKELKCSPEDSLLSTTEEESNNQKFRIKQDEYWLSVNENSGFKSVEKKITLEEKDDLDTVFKTKRLRVAHDIPGTGGPLRYQGDLIKTIGDEDSSITFIVPRDSNYKKITNYLEPQIHVDSSKIEEISRKIRGIEYTYYFQEPYVDYVLQLGDNLNRGPIVAIFPTTYNLDDKEVTEIIQYKGDDILTFGIDVLQGLNLGESEAYQYVLEYDPDYKSKKMQAKTNSKTEKVEGEVTIGDYVAQKCYGKNYNELARNEENSVDYVASQLINKNNLVSELKGSDYSNLLNMDIKNKDITFPRSETTTFTNDNGNSVKIYPGPDNCPIISAKNIKETLSEKKSCIALNGEITAVCTKKEECYKPAIYGIVDYPKVQSQACLEEQVCCWTNQIITKKTYQKKSQLPIKKGRIRDDSLCTKLNGKCAFATENLCINEKTGLSIKWLTNKCLSNPNRNYLCCTGNLENQACILNCED